MPAGRIAVPLAFTTEVLLLLSLPAFAQFQTTTTCFTDCNAGLANFEAAWTEWKKHYCCVNENKGCPMTTTTTCLTDCNAGLNNWQAGWTQWKKDFCCRTEGKGCPMTTTTTCLTDCNAGLNNWQAAWTPWKKEFCCRTERKGCPVTTPPTSTITTPTTSVTITTPTTAPPTPAPTPAPTPFITAGPTRAAPMFCNLTCLDWRSGLPVKLRGAIGVGHGMSLNDVTFDQCRQACASEPLCEGIAYTDKTIGVPYKSMCYGRKKIRTSNCQPADGRFTLAVIRGRPYGKCAIFGDPHILSFDRVYGPPISIVDTGDWWLVKSAELAIQGRFGYTSRFPKATSLIGFVLTGSRIKNHKLACWWEGPEQGPPGYRVLWDGKPILQNLPSEYAADDGSMDGKHANMNPTSYHREGRHTIGGVDTDQPSFLFVFDDNFRIYVLLGPDNVNMVIHMTQLETPMDGLCGNFNCNVNDDLLDALERRGLAGPVAPALSLFQGLPQPSQEVTRQREDFEMSDCDPDTLVWAKRECAKMNHGEFMACVFDACAEDRHEAIKLGGVAAQQALARPDLPHNCNVGEPTGWDAMKKKWCCSHQQRCKPVPGAAAEPCQSMCTWDGKTKSCNARVLWAATRTDTGTPTACAIAHHLVLTECPVCAGCQLQKTTCRELWEHKHYFRRYGVTADPPAAKEVPAERGTNSKLPETLLMVGFAMAALGGMAMRCVYGGRLRQITGYSSARHLMSSRDDDEEASGTLLTFGSCHGGAE